MPEKLQQLSNALDAKFVAEMRGIAPNVANWAEKRLGEGFRLDEVQRVISDGIGSARR